ncbi:MAG: peptidyl-prolyl cis-trans isomerase [Phycisphaerales bacterium]|nr:peptidyl-prolyl cis-trans isomerase [Phycisphaerales bacterium]
MHARIWISLCGLGGLIAGCSDLNLGSWRLKDDAGPPDARRPQLKTDAELAADRAKALRSAAANPNAPSARGSIVADKQDNAAAPAPSPDLAPPLVPGKGTIRGGVLMVNDLPLTIPETLYPVRTELLAARAGQTDRGFESAARQIIINELRTDVGTLLLYQDATRELTDQQKKAIDTAVEREVKQRVAREFGGSEAKLDNHLATFGLTREEHDDMVKRAMVVRQYLRERLVARMTLRRDDLLNFYTANPDKWSTPASRELLLIEAPIATFLPDGVTMQTASPAAVARARLAATRHMRSAHEALRSRHFADVAKEFSRDTHAELGGSWGPIGQPLEGEPFHALSERIFKYHQGQYSEPVETEDAWYIVGCGEVVNAKTRSFAEAQDDIRQELERARFVKASNEYMAKLVERATITSMEEFIDAATTAVMSGQWPKSAIAKR